jgi:hypothetical protein
MKNEVTIEKIIDFRERGLQEEDAVESTAEFKDKFVGIFNKMEELFKVIGKDFDISDLRIYKTNNMYVHMESEQFGDAILLTKSFFEKDEEGQIFAFAHELIHYLSGTKMVAVGSKVHERSGFSLKHLGIEDDDINIGADFLTGFNEGVTEWITSIIIGNTDNIVYRQEYELIEHLVNQVGKRGLSKKDIISDYFNNGVKFLRAIKNEYGKGSIKILDMLQGEYKNKVIEFFMSNDRKKRKILRVDLLNNNVYSSKL